MCNRNYLYVFVIFINKIEDSIISNPYSVTFTSTKFFAITGEMDSLLMKEEYLLLYHGFLRVNYLILSPLTFLT